MTLKSTDTMERITRQQFADNFDEILEKVEKENVGYVILDNEGKDGQVLCPVRWFETEVNDIPSVMREIKHRKEEMYSLVEETISKIENDIITDEDAIEDFQSMLMDYGDDVKFFELYRSLNQVLNQKYPNRKKGKWE